MHSQPLKRKDDVVVIKNQLKVNSKLFNIVEHLRKATVSMPVLDALHLPGKKGLLQDALAKLSISDNANQGVEKFTFSNDLEVKNEQKGKEVKPPPFYLSLIIGDKFVHNCMVDFGSSGSIMPKILADKLGLVYEPKP